MQNWSSRVTRAVRSAISYGIPAFVMFVFVVSFTFPSQLRAAAGEGLVEISIGTDGFDATSATYGSAGSSASITVGDPAYVRLTTTVGVSGIAPNENNVTVQIPANIFPSGAWDTAPEASMSDVNAVGEWYVDYMDVDNVTTNNTGISFAASSATTGGLLSIQADQQMDYTDKFVLTFAAIGAYSSTSAAINIATDDTGASPEGVGSQPTLEVTATNADAEVALGSTVVGSSTTATINFNTPVALDADDTLEVTFPNHIDLTSAAYSSGTFSGCTVLAQTVTCTVSGSISAGSSSVVLSGVMAKYTATNDASDFIIADEGVTGNYIATDEDVALTDITAADANASVTVASPTVGATGDVTVTLTTPALDAGDTIDIAFPSYMNVSGVGSAVTGTLENGGEITCLTPGSGVVTCTVVSGTPLTSSATIIMTGITSAYVGTTNISSFEVEDQGVAENDIASDSDVALTDITAADAAASVVLESSTVGAEGDTTLTLTLPVDLVDTDTVTIALPNHMDASSVEFVSHSFVGEGTFACPSFGPAVVCTVTGTISAGTGNIVMSGITGMYTGTDPINFVSVESEGDSGKVIATTSDVALTDITAADAAASVVLESSTVGAEGDTTLTLTLPVDLVDTDTVTIALPNHMDASSVEFVSHSFVGEGTFACPSFGPAVVCTVTGTISAGTGNIVMSGITGMYTGTDPINFVSVESEGDSGKVIATTSDVALTDITAADAAASVVLESSTVGAEGDTTLTLTLPVDLVDTDTITIEFPGHINVSSAAYVSDSFSGSGAFACSAIDQVVTCTANGAITAGTGNIVMSGITGKYFGTDQITSFAVESEGDSAKDIATDEDVALTDITAADANASVTVASPTVGATGDVTVTLTTPALDAGDTIDIAFPSYMNVSGVGSAVTGTLENGGEITCLTPGSGVVTCTVVSGTPLTSSATIIMTGITGAYAGTANTVSLEIEDEGVAENDIASDSNVALTDIAAADAVASVVLASAIVGAEDEATLSLTLPVDLANTDTITAVFPDHVNVSSVAYYEDTFAGSGTFVCSADGQVVTCTANGTITAAYADIVMSGITGMYAGTDSITSVSVESEGDAAKDIAISSAVFLSEVRAADANASVTVASPTVGATGDVTVTLTTPALDAGDTIDIAFPSYMNVSGVGSAVTGTLENGGEITCLTPGSGVVTCTVVSGTPLTSSATIIMTGITSAYVGTTNISSFEVEDEGVSANDIASDSDVALTDITAADAAATVTLASSNVGSTTTATVAFTAPVALASGDTVDISFPSHLNVASAGLSSGTFSGCTVSSQDVTCTVNGAISAGSVSFVISGVRATYTASTDITSFEVEAGGNPSNDIATDSAVAMTNSSSGSSSSGGGGGSSATRYAIRVTSPTEGDDLTPGTRAEITWVSSGTGNISAVNLAYSLDKGVTYSTIVEGTKNDGSYEWTVPDVYADVVVLAQGTDLAKILATDESEVFSILGAKAAEGVDAEDVNVSEDSEEMLPTGTFMKSPSWSTVYYVEGSMRRPFLDAQTFFTYAENFDDVIEVDDAYLANYLVGKPMVVKAGVSLVKIQSVAKVYAVEMINGVQTLRWVASENVAKELFGNAWADYVIDVPPTAWTQFKVGEDIDHANDMTVNLENMKSRAMIAELM